MSRAPLSFAEVMRAAGATVTVDIVGRERFKVFEEHDKTEGRGGANLRYVVDDEREAKDLAAGLGVMGGPGRVERELVGVIRFAGREFVVPLSAIAVEPDTTQARLAAQAVRKLTLEERKALGLAG